MKKLILTLGVLLTFVLYTYTFYYLGKESSKQEYYNSNMNNMQVDLPEEISQLEDSDLLKGKWIGNTLHLGFYHPHKCSDTTHLTCDGECSCDGLGCD